MLWTHKFDNRKYIYHFQILFRMGTNIWISFFKLIRDELSRHAEENNLLPLGQDGSRSLRSTLTKFLSYWDTILNWLEPGTWQWGSQYILNSVNLLIKAETVVLLHKLQDARILGMAGKWLAAFLDSNFRMQAVAVEGAVPCPRCHVVSSIQVSSLRLRPRLSWERDKESIISSCVTISCKALVCFDNE